MDVDPDAYLRVMLRCDGPSPGLADEVRAILPNALRGPLDYEREPERASRASCSASNRASCSPATTASGTARRPTSGC